jgi:hypothetical protein
MRLHNIKLFLGLFVLLAYISIGVFGLFRFSHNSETPMANCPYAQNSFSVCENSLNHINNWRQFSNVIFPSFLFLFSFLFFGLVLYFFSKQNLLNKKQYFYKWKYYLDNKKLFACPNRIIKWLSLLENSPSLLHARHS